MSESDLDAGSSSNIFFDSFWPSHYLQQISRIFRPYGVMEHKSVNDIAVCIPLCISVAVREHLVCKGDFLYAISNDKYCDNLLTLKHFGQF